MDDTYTQAIKTTRKYMAEIIWTHAAQQVEIDGVPDSAVFDLDDSSLILKPGTKVAMGAIIQKAYPKDSGQRFRAISVKEDEWITKVELEEIPS